MDNWNIISAVSQFLPRSPYILHLWGCDSVYRVAAPVLQAKRINKDLSDENKRPSWPR